MKIVRWFLIFSLIPTTYLIVSLILSSITIDRKLDNEIRDKLIYLSTNGVHLDIVLSKNDLDSLLISGLKHNETDKYLSFGWGDENFYINTPTWGDLTFKNAFIALFLKSSTLIHVTRYKQIQPGWIKIEISENELQKLNAYLLKEFKTDENGMKIILEGLGYTSMDDFYKSKGSFSCFKTCNSWVNKGFKEGGLKSCLWTPFAFGIINKYDR